MFPLGPHASDEKRATEGDLIETRTRTSQGQPTANTPLPPLDYFLAFEAAADHGGFAGASRQLNLSETAISRKVRLLEKHFGLALFDRGHKSIEITPHGRELLARIRPALGGLREVNAEMRKSGKLRPVVLAATNSVASLWLTPRLQNFQAANPHLGIMLVASDDDAECLARNVDLSILRGDGHWKGYESQLVFGETVFPVCSPDFLKRNPEIAVIDGLAASSLIEVSSKHVEWMNWRTWLIQTGIPAPRLGRLTLFNTYPLSIYAALDSVGVALGWGHLVDQFIDSGKLVRPLGKRHVRTDSGYYLLTPQDRAPFPGRDEVSAWLRQESASRKRYGRQD